MSALQRRMNLNLSCPLCMCESGDTICSSLLLIVVQIVRWAPLVLAVLECVRVRTVRSARLWMGPAPVLLDSLDPCARMVGDNSVVGVGGVSRVGHCHSCVSYRRGYVDMFQEPNM